MIRKEPAASGARALHKLLDVLEAVKESPSGATAVEISRDLGIPKSTVYRIVATLGSRGYLNRDEEGRYRLARKLLQIGTEESIDQLLRKTATPVMERLAKKSRETVNLGVIDGGEVTVIATIESSQALRMSSKVGNRRYLHSTALGKVLLAGLPDKEILRTVRIKGMPQFTEKTIVVETELMDKIQEVRRKRYAIDNQEQEVNGRCLAAAIVGPDGRVVAALGISGPVHRMNKASVRRMIPPLWRACEEIARTLQPSHR